MSLKQLFKKWSWLFGLIGFSIVVAANFVLPHYLKPDLDADITFYAIESMTEIPIRVHLDNMTADYLIVDFEGLEMYMGVIRTQPAVTEFPGSLPGNHYPAGMRYRQNAMARTAHHRQRHVQGGHQI